TTPGPTTPGPTTPGPTRPGRPARRRPATAGGPVRRRTRRPWTSPATPRRSATCSPPSAKGVNPRSAARPAGTRWRSSAPSTSPPARAARLPSAHDGHPRLVSVVLSGFADEISADPEEQLATLAAESIRYLELRSAWSVNVADFTAGQLSAFRAALDRAGVRVSAIGSPIGKIPPEAPPRPPLSRLRPPPAT